MTTLYEVRVFERKPGGIANFDISITSTKGTKKSKKTQFFATLRVKEGKMIIVRDRKRGCSQKTELWNDTNYVSLCQAVLAWFFHDVKNRRAYSTEDDTAFWHFKKTERFGDRYTLYECGLFFLTWNLKKWLSTLHQIEGI